MSASFVFCSTVEAAPSATLSDPEVSVALPEGANVTPAQGQAQPPAPHKLIDLQLLAPLGCPDRDAIESTLARLVTEPPAMPLRVTARFTPDNGRWVLFATLDNGQRVIAGDSCVAVAEALVVIMALAIDPKAQLGAEAFRDFERANTASSTTRPEARATSNNTQIGGGWRMYEDPPKPRDSVPERHHGNVDRWGLSLLMLSEVGTLPEWSLGPSLVTRYGSFALWGELALSTLWPRFAGTSTNPGKGGRIGWFGAQVSACAGLGAGLPLAACAGFESGDVYGYGVNTAYKQVGYGFWSAFTAGAVYRGELRHDWGLELRLGSAVPLSRPAFGLDGYGEVFQPSAVSLRAEVGLAWR